MKSTKLIEMIIMTKGRGDKLLVGGIIFVELFLQQHFGHK